VKRQESDYRQAVAPGTIGQKLSAFSNLVGSWAGLTAVAEDDPDDAAGESAPFSWSFSWSWTRPNIPSLSRQFTLLLLTMFAGVGCFAFGCAFAVKAEYTHVVGALLLAHLGCSLAHCRTVLLQVTPRQIPGIWQCPTFQAPAQMCRRKKKVR